MTQARLAAQDIQDRRREQAKAMWIKASDQIITMLDGYAAAQKGRWGSDVEAEAALVAWERYMVAHELEQFAWENYEFCSRLAASTE